MSRAPEPTDPATPRARVAGSCPVGACRRPGWIYLDADPPDPDVGLLAAGTRISEWEFPGCSCESDPLVDALRYEDAVALQALARR